MSDIKFSCPSCQQHIQADEGYAGLQINCPACQASLLAPGSRPAPVSSPASLPSYAPPPPPPPAPAPASSTGGCPSCGNPLPRGAMICTKCGYNLATKQRTVAGRVVPMGKAMAPRGEEPWYKTPWPYLAVVVSVLGTLYYMGRTNHGMMMLFVAVLLLYCFGVHVLVIIAAFQDSTGMGFLTMCVPFYGYYYDENHHNNGRFQ